MARKLPQKYWECIVWIAANDDTEFLKDAEPQLNVTASMVADLFNVKPEIVIEHLCKALKIDYNKRGN